MFEPLSHLLHRVIGCILSCHLTSSPHLLYMDLHYWAGLHYCNCAHDGLDIWEQKKKFCERSVTALDRVQQQEILAKQFMFCCT